MENKVVDELNNVLKGEQMAVEAYGKYIDAVEDEEVRKELKKIQEDHKRHAQEISQRVTVLGGKPEQGTGLTGVMGNAKIAIKTMMSKSSVEILKQAYDGEDKGIAMVEELVKGDLDKESARLINSTLSDDHDHLSKLAHIIAKFETAH